MAVAKVPFKRYCKTLQLRDDPQLIKKYKQVHGIGAAWLEVTQGMKEVGILDMEIYMHGCTLFMIMDTVADFNHDRAMAALAKKPRQVEWEAFVSSFQCTGLDSSANEKWQLMERAYELDQQAEYTPEEGQLKI